MRTKPLSNRYSIPWAWLTALLLPLLAAWGCGGLPSEGEQQTAGSVVVLVVEAGTNAQIQVPVTVIVGGVRGVLNVGDQQVVLRNVPVGTGTPPTQPMTVTARGYVTLVQQVQLNVTTATWVQAELTPADTATTGTIAGTVTEEGSGGPIANAFVQFTPPGAAEPMVGGYTDAQGAFIIGGIPAGNRDVTVQAAGYLPFTTSRRIVADDAGGNADLNVTLVSGSTKITVIGTVVDVLTHRPIAGATVTIGDSEPVISDANGRFRVENVHVGDQTVRAEASGYDPYEATLTVLPGLGEITIEMFESAQEPPGGPYTIGGTVVLSGAPDNAGATVRAVSLATSAVMDEEVTGATGRYGLFVPPGRYEVIVSFAGRRLSQEVTVPPGGVVVDGVNFLLTVE